VKLHRVELDNLASLAGPHVIDFERGLGDAPMFVIVGPTGAGKSTVLDAVALALFGETPRLSNARGDGGEDLDARHIMSRGTGRCRATLEFSTAGQATLGRQRWRATWACRRAGQQPDGALQRPTRALERWVPAEDRWLLVVDDDRKKIYAPAFDEALHGLGVDEFQRSMLLAQGEFAALLLASPADKGAILERLTSTETYLAIGRRCAEATRDATRELERLEVELGGTPPRDEDVAALEARVASASAAALALDAALQRAEQTRRALAEHAALAQAEQQFAAERPLLERDQRARTILAEVAADQRVAAAAAQRRDKLSHDLSLRQAELATTSEPTAPAVRSPELDLRVARIAQIQADVALAGAIGPRLAQREAERADLDRRVQLLEEALPKLRRKQADAEVRRAWAQQRAALVAGEACPVCGSRDHPAVTHAAALEDGEASAVKSAERELKTLELARRMLAESITNDRSLAARAATLGELLRSEESALALAVADQQRDAAAARTQREAELVARRDAAREALAEATLAADEARRAVEVVLARHQTTLATLQGELLPASVRDRMEAQAARLAARRDALEPLADDATGELTSVERGLAELASERAATWQTLGADKRALAELRALVARTSTLRAAWDKASSDADRWRRLHRLIGEREGQAFREFAQILNLEVLVDCANHHLRALAPRFRLTPADDRQGRARLDFAVRDMMQAGRVRPITTLSGGETFLVSLALALGLADLRTSELPIETLLLDEGFGTLDGDALEQALAALEELQARTGLQLGIISHVTAVSERIAARIVVTPLGQGRSQVTTVLAP